MVPSLVVADGLSVYHDGHSNKNVKNWRRTFKKLPYSRKIHGHTVFQKTCLWPSWLWPSWSLFVAVMVCGHHCRTPMDESAAPLMSTFIHRLYNQFRMAVVYCRCLRFRMFYHLHCDFGIEGAILGLLRAKSGVSVRKLTHFNAHPPNQIWGGPKPLARPIMVQCSVIFISFSCVMHMQLFISCCH